MNWQTDGALLQVGVDYLVQFMDGQYMVGTWSRHRQMFTSSDGAWSFELKQVTRFVEITD